MPPVVPSPLPGDPAPQNPPIGWPMRLFSQLRSDSSSQTVSRRGGMAGQGDQPRRLDPRSFTRPGQIGIARSHSVLQFNQEGQRGKPITLPYFLRCSFPHHLLRHRLILAPNDGAGPAPMEALHHVERRPSTLRSPWTRRQTRSDSPPRPGCDRPGCRRESVPRSPSAQG
jgi:hypothetical protein